MSYKYEYINVIGNMSIRPAPNTSNTAVGNLPVNTKAFGNELHQYPNGDRWVKIEQGGSAVGWVAVIHGGKPYGTLSELILPEPTVPIPPFKLDVEWTGEELLVFVDGEEYAKKSS